MPCAKGTKVISLGIADNMDFELELIDSTLAQEIYCFDGSIPELPELRSNIYFESKFVKTKSCQDSLTLNEILGRTHADELILKIDIEGDEWAVLGDLEENELRKFSQIIGEFHGLASSINEEDINLKINLLNKLHRHFYLVNAHPNNWSRFRIVQGVPLFDVAELSFINRNQESICELKVGGTDIDKIFESLNSPCNPDGYEYLA
jgi:ribosomal protein S13